MIPRLGEKVVPSWRLGKRRSSRTHSVVVVHVGNLLNRCPGGDVDPVLRREAGLEAELPGCLQCRGDPHGRVRAGRNPHKHPLYEGEQAKVKRCPGHTSPGSGIRASGSSCIKNPDLGVAGVGQGMRGWGNPSAHPLLGEGAARRGC